MPTSDRAHLPRWYAVPARALFVTLLMTLLSFAVSLLLSIVGVVIISRLHGTTPDLLFAYRHLALPVALVVGSIVLVLSIAMEVRHYRQAKTLAGILRASR
jgi:hypothetical protein